MAGPTFFFIESCPGYPLFKSKGNGEFALAVVERDKAFQGHVSRSRSASRFEVFPFPSKPESLLTRFLSPYRQRVRTRGFAGGSPAKT